MIGNNELPVNEATMIAAVQLWLNSISGANAPKVTAVYEATRDDKNQLTFVIKFDGGEKK